MSDEQNDFAKKISEGYQQNTGKNWFESVKRRLGLGTKAPAATPSPTPKPTQDDKEE